MSLGEEKDSHNYDNLKNTIAEQDEGIALFTSLPSLLSAHCTEEKQ